MYIDNKITMIVLKTNNIDVLFIYTYICGITDLAGMNKIMSSTKMYGLILKVKIFWPYYLILFNNY